MALPLGTAKRYARSLHRQLAIAVGPRGKAQVLHYAALGRRPGPHEPIAVPLRALGGASLWVRPGTSDLRNATYYYEADLFEPPPGRGQEDLRQIVEVGTNVGAALSGLAHRYPAARLLGAEPDPGNAAVAALNAASFGERCQVVPVGIWDEDTNLVVERSTRYGEHGFAVRKRTPEDPPSTTSIRAVTIDTLLARYMPEGPIDYMHMTIEGTEPRVLAHGGEWVRRVRSLRLEAHPEMNIPAIDIAAALERLGYRTERDAALPDKWVFGIRD